MGNVISCRVGVYASLEEAFTKLPETGIQHAEVGASADTDYAALAKLAADSGMTISTTATGCEVGNPESMANFAKIVEGTASIGTSKMFVSIKGAEGVERSALMAGLRETAERAAALGIALCMETHPPFGHNAAEALRTVEEVGSDGLRTNFDTANIYYYNENVDGCEQLEKVAQIVGAVHLKDTDGLPKSANFPVLGQGVVDFPRTFEILGAIGFTGPYTLELEGTSVAGKDEEGRHAAVVACMDYLKSIRVA